ncbi:hypothetical protein J2X42_001811 [Arthrobacter sp. BE255]|nr:hypothetical protein [Arthrobacter sp. BE255]
MTSANTEREPAPCGPPQVPPGNIDVAQWTQLSLGDGIRVLDQRGVLIQGLIDARSTDGQTIWVTGGSLRSRRLFHISDDIRLQRTTRALNRT